MVKVFRRENTVLLTCDEEKNNYDFYITECGENDENVKYMISFIPYGNVGDYNVLSGYIKRKDSQNAIVISAFEESLFKDKKCNTVSPNAVETPSFFVNNSFHKDLSFHILGDKGCYGLVNIEKGNKTAIEKINTLYNSLYEIAVEYTGNDYLFPCNIKKPDEFDCVATGRTLSKEKQKVIRYLHMKRLTKED